MYLDNSVNICIFSNLQTLHLKISTKIVYLQVLEEIISPRVLAAGEDGIVSILLSFHSVLIEGTQCVGEVPS